MKAKEFIPASKPRNFVAKNAPTSGAGRHRDSGKKKDREQGKVKHKKDLVPMEGVAEGSAHGYNVARYYAKYNDQKKITNWLRTNAGLDKTAPVYFDDADLVYGDQTIVPDALVNPKYKMSDLLAAVVQAADNGVTERVRDPEDWDEGNTEPGNNFAVYINGKKWKVFPGPLGAYADSPEERREFQRLKAMAERKSQQTGKKWEIHITGEKATESVEEGWKEKLGAAALAGSLAFGAAGAGARTLPGADPNINRFTGKPIATQQDTQQDKASDAKKDAGQQQIGFSTEYLKKVVDGKHPRPMISVDDAKQELERRGEL